VGTASTQKRRLVGLKEIHGDEVGKASIYTEGVRQPSTYGREANPQCDPSSITIGVKILIPEIKFNRC